MMKKEGGMKKWGFQSAKSLKAAVNDRQTKEMKNKRKKRRQKREKLETLKIFEL